MRHQRPQPLALGVMGTDDAIRDPVDGIAEPLLLPPCRATPTAPAVDQRRAG
jgi:hypothetical protein